MHGFNFIVFPTRHFNAIDIRIEGSTLIIRTKKGYIIKKSEEVKATISAPNVNYLMVSGSGLLKTSAINAVNQTITISGSGNLTADQLNVENLTVTINVSSFESVNLINAN